MKRHRGKKASKYMWALLHPESEVITEENRVEAYNWLEEISSKMTTGLIGIDSSDVGHNWLGKTVSPAYSCAIAENQSDFESYPTGCNYCTT